MTTWRWATNWRTELHDAADGIMDRAGETVERGAKRRAPVSPDGSYGHPPGWMRDTIYRSSSHDDAGLFVDVTSPAHYSIFVELGTRPHSIDSHGPWPLRDRRGRVFGRHVNHPGTTAQPFLRPALDDIAGRTLQ